MIIYRVRYKSRHDLGDWSSLMTYRRTKKAAEQFRDEVIRDNARDLEEDRDNPWVPEDVLSPTIDKIDICNKQRLLDELSLAVCSGQV
ncbi:MAG: hypothetical protein AWU57_944 [Marinobacter sp. T13-3]|nr:MAG: hypothetical protein AWU57_944 [Marinobacter sp. T13-3]